MSKQRLQQVADTIQQILGSVIQNELKDPRVGFATVTGVQVSPDLQRATVRISVMGEEAEQSATMEALLRARGFLRRRVAEEMSHMRFVPELRLVQDTSLDYTMRINEVLREVEQERRANPPKLDQE
ncbi:30S ribosome-binding factor RbfA [Candidatus Viridilinea mediisalina]|uniref:Ribosome-binding factor A n=1 Tax=Candidatus Viridilinea mediisalina TaxID=2024553 RepID=A0A2A6RFB9_9CHLR|nr:30S ribosome-binding factor RbfA [Candidatus Viridilinea mediisalina]PDW01643.1 ribosome-binding factor A [Candidatus Viridilinea mediisalina]